MTTISSPARVRGRTGAAMLPLQLLAPFESLSEREARMLDAALPCLRWREAAPAPAELRRPDQLVIVRQGTLERLSTPPTGGEVVVGVLGPGDVFSTFGNTRAPSLRPLGDTRLSLISRERVQAAMMRVPRLGLALIAALSAQVEDATQRASVLSELRVEDRLWGVFIRLARNHGIVTGQGVELALGLTHAQWAHQVGASREAVTAALLRLRRRGLIACRGRTVVLALDAALPALFGETADLEEPPRREVDATAA